MSVLVAFCCDSCNPSRQRRDPGDEVSTGYVEILNPMPGYHPPGWKVGDGPGGTRLHFCPQCFTPSPRPPEDGDSAATTPTGAGTSPDVPNGGGPPRKGPRWPSVTSPFGDAVEAGAMEAAGHGG